MIVPGGGLSRDGTKWIACRPRYFLTVEVLSALFRTEAGIVQCNNRSQKAQKVSAGLVVLDREKLQPIFASNVSLLAPAKE